MGTTARTYRVDGYANASALMIAHLRGLRGNTLVPGEISRIVYSVWKLASNGVHMEPVEGHSGIELDLSEVFFDLREESFMSGGTLVTNSINFQHQIDNSNCECFPERGGRYLVRYDIFPVSGCVSPIQYIVEAQ